MNNWDCLLEPNDLFSPSLVIDRALVLRNLRRMLEIAGSPDRLRPHVKTHKMPAIVAIETSLGITKHKVATIAEAEMVARAGGSDILIAFPMVGPNIQRLANLVKAFPEVTFRTLVDDPRAAQSLSEGLSHLGPRVKVPALIDLNVGMGRTGIDPGEHAITLYQILERLPNLEPDGLSAYDGQIHDKALDDRKVSARPGVEATLNLRDRLLKQGLDVPRVVIGGTPTFPVHAKLDLPGLECSPGTTVLHDQSYIEKYPDLPFQIAAVLLTRVISRPQPGRICLDLGHKAVSADPVGPRLKLWNLPDAVLGGQSEEHLIVETSAADRFPPGTTLVGLPMHICPTVALHRWAYVLEAGRLVDRWEVVARDRILTI